MNFTAQHAWALARCVAAGLFGVALGTALRALLLTSGRRARRVLWFALLAPYLTPVLLVGYAYSNFSLSLVRHPVLNELLYSVLVFMKLAPIAALVLYFAPPSVSPEAVHCRRLLRTRRPGVLSVLSYVGFLLRGPLRSCAAAFALVFLLAFGEFEMASLLGVRTWSVSVFDAHAGGLALSESLRLMAVPVLFEAGLLLAALVVLWRSGSAVGAAGLHRVSLGRKARCLSWAYLAVAGVIVTLLPALIVLRGTGRGMRVVARDFVLGQDIGASLLLAGGAVVCAYVPARWCVARALPAGRAKGGLLAALALSIPGLLGALVVSLLTVFLFQSVGLRALYDTPVPLLLALTAILLPFAVLLCALLRVLRGEGALHAARLLGSSVFGRVREWRRRLMWRLKGRAEFWVIFLLFCWGYFDLTASAILAPAGMTPVTVRLYNLMHYGRTDVLSAMVCVAFLVPLLVLAFARGVRGVLSVWAAHG